MEYRNRIAEWRNTRGLSLEALADKVGTSPQQLSRLELGQRRLSDHWMAKLAPALGCQPWELLPADMAPASDSFSAELVTIFKNLPEDRRERLLNLAREM